MTTRIITISMLGLLLAQAVTTAEFHVASNGNDANPGTQAKPISVKATPDDKSWQEAPRHPTTADNNPGPNRSAAASAARPDIATTVRVLVGACKGVWAAPVGEVVAPGCDMAERANGPLLGNGHGPRCPKTAAILPDDRSGRRGCTVCRQPFRQHARCLQLHE